MITLPLTPTYGVVTAFKAIDGEPHTYEMDQWVLEPTGTRFVSLREGWRLDPGAVLAWEPMVLSSPVDLESIKAAIWDEGYAASDSDAESGDETHNPYRMTAAITAVFGQRVAS